MGGEVSGVERVSDDQDPPRDGEGDRPQGGGGGRPSLRCPETYTARRLRREMTLPEVLLWNALRSNGLGLKFRRQHSIKPHVVDFYCAAARLAIEVDGIAHTMGDRPQRDEKRDREITQKGYSILRLAAVDVLRDPFEAAISVVAVAGPLRQSLRDCHLPMNGEDL